MFKAVYGAADFDHNRYLFRKLRKNLQREVKSYVLVPEQFSVFTERKAMEELGAKAQSLIEVLTFSRLSNLVMSELGPLRLRYIDGASREILGARAMQPIENKLEYFKPNVHQKGFPHLLVELTSEFKRYGHLPEALTAASEEVDEEELSRKLRDLALFYETYNGLIEKSGSDAEDNLSIILPKIKDFPTDKNSRLYIAEFRSFTPLEYRVLTELMHKAHETELILCCDSIKAPTDPFVTAAAACRALYRSAQDAGVETAPPESPCCPKERQWDIAHTLNNYFKIKWEKTDKAPEHIHFLHPDTYYDEIDAAAQIINRLCRTKGYSQSDILILARNSEVYSGIMPLVFESCGINVFLDKRRNITENPYLRCLNSILEILAYGFSYERALNIARSGFCKGITDEDIDVFDNYILAVNPSHAMWNSEADWSFNPDKRTYNMERINKIKNTLLKPVFDFRAHLKGRKTAEEITNEIFRCMESCCHEELMKELCSEYSKEGLVYLAEEYRMTWNSVVSVLNGISQIMKDTALSYERYYELFAASCSGIKVGVSPQTIDGVIFSSIDMFRNTDAKAVIVLGVTDGVFPKGYDSEGLITDSERLLLRNHGIDLARTAAEKSFDENVLIYNVLASASEELYLMSPKGLDAEEELRPSKLITRIRDELFAAAPQEETEEAECAEFALRDLMAELAKRQGRSEDLDGSSREIYEFFKDSPRLAEFRKGIDAAVNGGEILSKTMAEKLYGKDVMLSVSKLEKFNACAFSYFMRYGLVAKPREVAAFDPLQMGNILHGAMEQYFSAKNTDTDYSKITKNECRRDIERILGELAKGADEVMYQSSAYYKYLVTRMSGIAAATAWETIKFFRNSDFRPYGFEIRIGKDGQIPPIRIETRYGNASIEGFVDRADSAVIDGKRYISIVDYKSSPRALDKDLAEAGVRFQPLVYANALCGLEENEPAAMLYQQMNDPIIPCEKAGSEDALETETSKNVRALGWVVDEPSALNAFDKNHGTKKCYINPRSALPAEELKSRLEKAEQKIIDSAEGILSGEISINPYIKHGFNPCDYCDYSDICSQTKE